jgi:hypothetical protein
MERADIEKVFTFTDYSWSLYEETVRPLGDEMITRRRPVPAGPRSETRSRISTGPTSAGWQTRSQRPTSRSNASPYGMSSTHTAAASVITLADISTRSITTSFRRRAR